MLPAAEITLRLLDAYRGRPTGVLYEHVVPRGRRFTMSPGTSVVVPERYGDVTYAFNARGYRDEEAPPPGSRPIVLLGDSVSFGLGVAQDQIFAARLEQAGLGEVMNLAMWAYDSCHEAETLEEEGPAAARAVVVQFFMNDLAVDRSDGSEPLRLGQRLTIARNRLLNASRAWLRLRQAAAATAYALFHDARRRHPENLDATEPRDKATYLAAHPDDASVEAFECLVQAAQTAERRATPVLIVNTPAEAQLFDTRYDAIGGRLAAFCSRHELAFLDTLPALRAAPERERLFLDGVHLSPEGHRRVATLIAARLAELGL